MGVWRSVASAPAGWGAAEILPNETSFCSMASLYILCLELPFQGTSPSVAMILTESCGPSGVGAAEILCNETSFCSMASLYIYAWNFRSRALESRA